MKRKYLLVIVLSLVVTTAAAVYFFTSAEHSLQKEVTVQCMSMTYACGDCHPQYNVRQVLPASLEKKVLAKDIDIEFANNKQEEEIKKQIGICGICYIYNFKGDLYYSEKKDCYVMRLGEYKLQLKDEKCCEP